MSKELYIFGTGAHARKVFHCATQAGYAVKAFVDENRGVHAPTGSLPVMSPETLKTMPVVGDMIIAIGDSKVRQRLMDEYFECGWRLPPIVHPKASVAPDAVLEDGVLIAAGALVESGSIIGRGTIVDIGVVVDHDCMIAPFSHLRPGVVCQSCTQWLGENL